MREYIFLISFTYPHECLVIKNLFEQENIRFYMRNETLVSLIPFSSNAFGGIRLMVHPKDFKKAKKILDSFQNSSHLKIV
ncbi:putative signal transducing protein [Salegentibacter chungangensis]|uniref:DUF2007 domain-containing protein n=1 Tax=Salegentibacter chungangensis TaxID=1335724 RepID=A0ABW3NPA9_9FLAO